MPNLHPELEASIDAAFERHNPAAIVENVPDLEEAIEQSLQLNKGDKEKELYELNNELLVVEDQINRLELETSIMPRYLLSLLENKSRIARRMITLEAEINEEIVDQLARKAELRMENNYEAALHKISTSAIANHAIDIARILINRGSIVDAVAHIKGTLAGMFGIETINSITAELAMTYARNAVSTTRNNSEILVSLSLFNLDADNVGWIRQSLDSFCF
jgi:hypothetical protein